MTVEAWHYTVLIVLGYALLFLFLGMGKWSRLTRVAMDDYFKVAPGFGFVVLYLGIAGGFHTAFAIPGSMGFYYRHGVAFSANILWTVFTPLGMIYFFGARIACLGRKFNYITPADMLVDYFGEGKFRAFISLYMLSCCIPLMTANITGPAKLLSGGTDDHISYTMALLIMGAMVTIYVTSRGLRGVTWTTVAQAIWMFAAVWAAAIWCLVLIEGDLAKLWHAVEEVEPRLLTLPGPEGKATWQWWLTWPVFGIALYWAILPRGFLFFYSARDVKTVRRIGLTVGFYLMGLYLPAIVIGFTARCYLPGLLGSEADVAFPRLLAEYAPAWFTGVIVAGGLAAGMSSLDADTNANSAMLTQDVYRSFLRRQATDRHYIFVGRLCVVGLVALTVVLAMRDWGLVTLMIGVTASMITQLLPAVIAVTVPLRLRITKAGVTCGIVAGFTASLLVYLLAWFCPALGFGWGFDPSFWGLVANVPVLLVVSRFTSLPDPRAVARIRGVLEEEFGRQSTQAT